MNIEKLEISQTLPAIVCDYEGLRQWAKGIVEKYQDLVITEDQVKEIKKEMAELNKAKDKLNRARIDTVKAISAPIAEFERQIKDICLMFSAAYNSLGEQVKRFEDAEKEERRKKVQAMIDAALEKYPMPDWLAKEIEIQPLWLNKTTNTKRLEEAINAAIEEKQRHYKRECWISEQWSELSDLYGYVIPLAVFLTPENFSREQSEVLASMRAEYERRKPAPAQPSLMGEKQAVANDKEAIPVPPELAKEKLEPCTIGQWTMTVTFPIERKEEVRQIMGDCQVMRIYRRLLSAGLERKSQIGSMTYMQHLSDLSIIGSFSKMQNGTGYRIDRPIGKLPDNAWRKSKRALSQRSRANRRKAKRNGKNRN